MAPPAPVPRDFLDRGWMLFPAAPAMRSWIEAAAPVAAAAAAAPDNAHWHRHGGTWFVGVNALPNDGAGALPGGPALAGPAIDLARVLMAGEALDLDRGQVSICSPGYPRRDPGQSEASHRYRVARDAAHVDGLHAERPSNRRYVREFHAFILGVPLAAVESGHSPLVVWEGSHRIMGAALAAALEGADPEAWPQIDLTDVYHAARQRCFAVCRRVEIITRPGETYVVHRLALHGMAPWTAIDGTARTVIYFRPAFRDRTRWLRDP